jgi:hypothetical protein
MTTERDPRTRIVLSWLREDAHENAERVLLQALDEVDTTPQRRSWWPAWRSDRMNTYAKLIVGAAAVLVVAVIGYQFLPTQRGGVGGQPTIAPSPSPALLARGTFKLYGADVELDATGGGDSVTGTMTVSHQDGDFSVDLKCTRTTEDGVILIAGDITDSASPHAREGAREVIVLKRGSPAYASFDSEGRQGGDVRPAASCPALLEQVIDTGTQTVIGPNGLEPIDGTVELGP